MDTNNTERELRQALEHCLNWLPEDCAAACEARAALSLPAAASQIPPGVHYGAQFDNFYDSATMEGMGTDFWMQWKHRRDEFPTKAAAASPQRCPRCDDTGDVHRADGEWLGRCSCAAVAASPQKAEGEAVTIDDEDECTHGLPAWHDILTKQKQLGANSLTPLERFILDNEPAGREDENDFRKQLAAVLALAAPVQPAEGAELSDEERFDRKYHGYDDEASQPAEKDGARELLREAMETIDTLPGYPKGADLCDRIETYLSAMSTGTQKEADHG